jgi:nucleotide-binding universal stress UspA family protein
MAYKDIVVHSDSSDTGKHRMEIAASLAAKHDARLIGLFTEGTTYVPPMADLAQLPAAYFEEQEEAMREESDATREIFTEICAKSGVSNEWRSIQGLAFDVLLTSARYADLIILGQRPPGSYPLLGDYPGGLVLSAGRPVLIIPDVGRHDVIGSKVMIGWDGGAPATRAVHDAIPLMRDADLVDVIAINPDTTGHHGQEPGADIGRHLAGHGLNVEAESMTVNNIGVADMLLSRAADKSIDLFVMGAYGHARWREMVLGGVTAHMLENMTMPVLMSH